MGVIAAGLVAFGRAPGIGIGSSTVGAGQQPMARARILDPIAAAQAIGPGVPIIEGICGTDRIWQRKLSRTATAPGRLGGFVGGGESGLARLPNGHDVRFRFGDGPRFERFHRIHDSGLRREAVGPDGGADGGGAAGLFLWRGAPGFDVHNLDGSRGMPAASTSNVENLTLRGGFGRIVVKASEDLMDVGHGFPDLMRPAG